MLFFADHKIMSQLIKNNTILVVKNKNYRIQKKIGSGGFGEVYLANYVENGEDTIDLYAIKVVC